MPEHDPSTQKSSSTPTEVQLMQLFCKVHERHKLAMKINQINVILNVTMYFSTLQFKLITRVVLPLHKCAPFIKITRQSTHVEHVRNALCQNQIQTEGSFAIMQMY
jgi:hypothetical protein